MHLFGRKSVERFQRKYPVEHFWKIPSRRKSKAAGFFNSMDSRPNQKSGFFDSIFIIRRGVTEGYHGTMCMWQTNEQVFTRVRKSIPPHCILVKPCYLQIGRGQESGTRYMIAYRAIWLYACVRYWPVLGWSFSSPESLGLICNGQDHVTKRNDRLWPDENVDWCMCVSCLQFVWILTI